MAERERLLRDQHSDVVAMLPEGREAATELLEQITRHLATRPEWGCHGDTVTRSDGSPVTLVAEAPLETIGQLVPEDFCVMAKNAGDTEHRLVSAVLCFPAHWRLAEKLGRGISQIHAPVPHYDPGVARRVNRVFDAIRPEAPLFRINWAVVTRPDLFTPHPAPNRVKQSEPNIPIYIRIERQTFLRLPISQAIVFGIRTSISPLSGLIADEADALRTAIVRQTDATFAYKGGRDFFHTLIGRLDALIEDGSVEQ